MEYAQAHTLLLSMVNERVSGGQPYRLERIRRFLHELGDPHLAYPTLHVGGTSGKGSTATMLASVLQAAGKRTGLHAKPHLHSMTERARIDGEEISRERFAALLDEMLPAIERATRRGERPSYYEALLALTFLYFARECVDCAIIEVGLGGRLDGTNVIHPLVAGITSVGFDHMDVLGDTLEAIAAEKAGIAKANVPLVISIEEQGARAVVCAHAARVGAPVLDVLAGTRIDAVAQTPSGQRMRVRTANATYQLTLHSLGGFQRRNAATAISMLEALPAIWRPTHEQIVTGLERARIGGRMEIVAEHPSVVLDIAHNAEKATHLAAALRERFAAGRMVGIVAIGESKDAKEILRALARALDEVVLTRFEPTPGRPPTDPRLLLHYAHAVELAATVIEDPMQALEVTRARLTPQDVLVVTGSTFVVAQLRAAMLARSSEVA